MISLCHVNVVLVSVQSLEEAIELKNLYRSSFRPEVILYQQNEEKKKKSSALATFQHGNFHPSPCLAIMEMKLPFGSSDEFSPMTWLLVSHTLMYRRCLNFLST